MLNIDPGIIIIDNFYDDPDKIRQLALDTEYFEKGKSQDFSFGNAPWPGIMSKKSFIPEGLDLKISKVTNTRLQTNRTSDSGRFRISGINDTFTQYLHSDGIVDDGKGYAGVVYLNTIEQSKDMPGTVFYEHKETGNQICHNKEQLINIVKNNEYNDLKYWKEHLTIPMKYNRMILYRKYYFHGIGKLFGDTKENSRLVQVFFWEEM